jgi:hypothetical protein
MRKIPPLLLAEILSDPAYKTCMRRVLFKDHVCHGRITFEHAFIYGGRQINEKWAIIPLCEYAHNIGPYQFIGCMDKRLNEYLALRRATKEDLMKYPNRDWKQVMKQLEMYVSQKGKLL